MFIFKIQNVLLWDDFVPSATFLVTPMTDGSRAAIPRPFNNGIMCVSCGNMSITYTKLLRYQFKGK